MFQAPVHSLEKIRKARKKVKQLLLQIGLETCKEACEELDSYNPGDTNFSSTSWEDVSLWEAFGRRNGYRTKQFCCSLCNFETRLLSSYRNHLRRYHEDEKDQEIMSTCPSCPFTSQTNNVVKHMRIFHSSTRKVQVPAPKESPVKTQFSCAKCSFTDNLYYTTKKHVLMIHHKNELDNYFGERTEEELNGSSGLKVTAANRFYCKKCNFVINNQDALMYHIVTSEKHRDLDQMMRPDICDISRPRVRRPYKKFLVSNYGDSPKLPLLPPSPDTKKASLSQNGPSLGASPASVTNVVQAITSVHDPAGGLVKTTATVAPTAQVGFVTTSLPQNQNITLQASLPQSVFLSPRFALNQPVTATVLPSACNVGGQIIPGGQATMRPTVLPINQSLSGNLLPVNQPTVLTCPQPLQSLQMNQSMRPTLFSVNQQLKPGNAPGGQSGVPQNAFLTAPVIRQLIPTGKQVNGIPTYTLVTLPVAPCAIPAVTPPKAPVQFTQADRVVQSSTSPASAPSPLVVKQTQATTKKTPDPARAKTSAANMLDKETKQWKTCPVCNELFPSNVFEVHLQVAHIKQENNPDKPTKPATEPKEVVAVAAHASFLKVLKEKSIRCVTCKMFTQEKEVLQHLLMHGMVCLYCKAVFYELRNFVYHMKILHVNKKKIHGDFVKKGITIPCDANGTALFPRFDLTAYVSKEELGDKEMHIAVVAGAMANSAAPLYIKVQPSATKESTSGDKCTKCSFCDQAFSKSDEYEAHLKERHHIMPTVHTILKSPAFKCIHCCGVYTGNMTLSAIILHLQRCRNAPKDSIAAFELESSAASKGLDSGKAISGAEGQAASNETKTTMKNGPSASNSSPVPSKRRRLDPKLDPSDASALEKHVIMLLMIPDASATVSHETKKEFLLKYFHVKPYPSKREIELLAHLLDMWKSDVASFFGTRRYICMKFLKNHKPGVLLGFKVNELKLLQHDIDLPEDY